jgi:hypothetical protein
LGNFLKSIEDKEVNLVFIGQDAFEKNDNNWWLPDCLWDEVTENTIPIKKADKNQGEE